MGYRNNGVLAWWSSRYDFGAIRYRNDRVILAYHTRHADSRNTAHHTLAGTVVKKILESDMKTPGP